MPISIISPEFAFLNFNGIPTEVCDESIFYPLPVYGNLAIKSQVQIESDLLIPIEDKFYVGICSTESCCNTYRFKVSDNSFDICNPDTWNQGALNITDSEGLVNISNGYYQPNTLWQTLSTIFDTEITGCEFTSCKSLPLPFRFLVGNQGTGCFVYLEKITNNATVIYDNNIELTPVCKKYKWQTYFEGDTIPTSNPYHICNLNTIDSSNLFINGNFDENANGWDLTNLYWLDGKLLSVQSNSEEVINVVVTQTLNLNISKYYRLKFNYTNNLLSNVGYVRVADTANNEIYLTTFTYDENNNSTEFSCIFSVPNDGNYHIYIGYQAIPVFVFTLDNIILEEVINITSSNDSIGYTPIPTGYYTREELYVVLEEIIGIPFSCEFSSCCLQPKIEFTHTFPDDDTEFVYSLLDYWDFAQIVFPNIEMDGIVEVGECFKYCILDK
ncbi:MAG TPA: hypothetical protein P5509_11395, partial [Bacteroidales bacterium]|nr:hypothetical protein [Bacteroidales bacterium]